MIRQLDLTIVNYCIENYVCAGINASSQEVFSTCNNRSVCCDVTMYKYVGIHAASQEVFSRTRGVTNKRYHYMLLCVVIEPLHVTHDTSITHNFLAGRCTQSGARKRPQKYDGRFSLSKKVPNLRAFYGIKTSEKPYCK